MDLHKILGANAHWNINKAIAMEVGINGALLLANLISLEKYFAEKGKLINTKKGDGFFSQTTEKSTGNLPIGKKALDTAIKELERLDFIETCLAGVPARKHYKIKAKNILDFLIKADKEDKKKGKTSYSPMGQTGGYQSGITGYSQKGQTIKKENNNKLIIKKEKIKKEKSFLDFLSSLNFLKNFDFMNYKNGNGDLIFENEKFNEAIYYFIEMRKNIKAPLTARALHLICLKAEKDKINIFIKKLEQSTENCWKGIFDLKQTEEKNIASPSSAYELQKEEQMKRLAEYKRKQKLEQEV